MVAEYDVDIFQDLYAGTTPMKFDPENAVDSVINSGLWVVGTPEQVRDQYVELWRQLPAEYVVLIYHWAQQPAESVVRQLELFMEHVKPALDELTDYADLTGGQDRRGRQRPLPGYQARCSTRHRPISRRSPTGAWWWSSPTGTARTRAIS